VPLCERASGAGPDAGSTGVAPQRLSGTIFRHDETVEHLERHDEPHENASTRPAARRRPDKALLAVSLVVAIGIMLVLRGLLIGVTGEDRSNLPAQIERVDPVPDAVRVLSQTSVFVDLEEGYTGRLIIDGVEIDTISIDQIGAAGQAGASPIEPGQQISLPPVTIYEPGNATLTFTPTAGAPIEQFDEGLHDAVVVFWRIEDGPERSRSYSWTFNTV